MKSFTRDQLVFSKGIIASLALHGVVLGLLLLSHRFGSLPEPESVPDKPRTYLLVTTGPPRPVKVQPDATIVEVSPTPADGATDPSQALSSEELEPGESQATDAEPAAEAAAVEQIARFVPSPVISPGVPASGSPGNQSIENSGAPGIGTAEINNSVTAYVANYKRSLTSDWLTACLQYQNEHGVKTCPTGDDGRSETSRSVNETTSQLFSSYVSGRATNIRVSKQLLAEMEAARSLMKDSSVMGELARQRYQLAEANYCRLNSCRSFALSTNASFATPASNDGYMTILTFALGDGPGILPSLTVAMGGAKPSGPVAVFVPYRFTGIRTQQGESEDEFKKKAPVFPVRR